MTEQECITLNMIMTAIVYDYGVGFTDYEKANRLYTQEGWVILFLNSTI